MSARCPSALIAFVAAVFATQAHAQAAAPAAAAQPGSAPGAATAPPANSELGRFFFTPPQRSALDEARRRPSALASKIDKPLPAAPELVTVNGVVQRSDGTTTVWLNNKAVRGGETDEGLQVTPSTRAASAGNVTLRVPQTGRVVDLKVGQQVEVTSGRVSETYRSSRRAQLAAEATQPSGESYESRPPRRVSRERELLRDLLRDIEPPPPAAASDERPGGSAGTEAGK